MQNIITLSSPKFTNNDDSHDSSTSEYEENKLHEIEARNRRLGKLGKLVKSSILKRIKLMNAYVDSNKHFKYNFRLACKRYKERNHAPKKSRAMSKVCASTRHSSVESERNEPAVDSLEDSNTH
mmetsp:Transcript_36897/g.36520  ORF Transcript_36897/g.36520 Transcript_36897/m.36520 type:complete len:124 (-) Transcript_36897:109-480(-)